MSHTQHTARSKGWCILHALWLFAVCLGLSSCENLDKKPIPELDPKLSTVIEEAAPVAVTSNKQGTITRMPLGTLYQLVQSKAALIFDVRPHIFYKLGHIPDAISFPKSNFDKDIAKNEALIENAIKKHIPVVIYCTDLACPDALIVATQLSERGYNTAVLQGGYEAWKTATE
jgi:rhodanese-related sulfurtransferase